MSRIQSLENIGWGKKINNEDAEEDRTGRRKRNFGKLDMGHEIFCFDDRGSAAHTPETMCPVHKVERKCPAFLVAGLMLILSPT